MDQVVFRTDDIPVRDRLEAWRDCMSRTMAPMHVVSSSEGDLSVVQRLVPLGGASVWPADTTACAYNRTRTQIRQADPELVHLTLLSRSCGPLVTRHAGIDATHPPGDFYMLDSSLPIHVRSRHPGDRVTGIGVEVPKAALPRAGRTGLTPLLGRTLSGSSGFGSLLAHFLTSVGDDASQYRHSDVPRLATVLTDLVAGLVAQELDHRPRVPLEVRERNLRLAVRAHIQRNLHDPRLVPASVAAQHHLSLRQLHRLFEGEEYTVAGYIRRLRLERARRALADAESDATQVGAVAARSGFLSTAHFSRAFRSAFGTSPSEYRRAAREGTVELPDRAGRGVAPRSEPSTSPSAGGDAGGRGAAPGPGSAEAAPGAPGAPTPES
nr:helix-turn-helix domain-containing protein [Streptomyces spiramenti]